MQAYYREPIPGNVSHLPPLTGPGQGQRGSDISVEGIISEMFCFARTYLVQR